MATEKVTELNATKSEETNIDQDLNLILIWAKLVN